MKILLAFIELIWIAIFWLIYDNKKQLKSKNSKRNNNSLLIKCQKLELKNKQLVIDHENILNDFQEKLLLISKLEAKNKHLSDDYNTLMVISKKLNFENQKIVEDYKNILSESQSKSLLIADLKSQINTSLENKLSCHHIKPEEIKSEIVEHEEIEFDKDENEVEFEVELDEYENNDFEEKELEYEFSSYINSYWRNYNTGWWYDDENDWYDKYGFYEDNHDKED